MKKKLLKLFTSSILILSIIVASGYCYDEFIFIKSISANVTFFTVDILGNFYVVQKKTLTKYDENGNNINTYDSKNLGEITSVDVSNPLKILVYYKDFNQVVFLDNTLSVSGSPIQLEELGIAQSSFACTSYGNAFWVFDNTLSRLVRFDKNLVIQNQSDNLSQEPGLINTSYMIEKNSTLYVCNSLKGIYIFDKFGTYGKTFPISDIHSMEIIDNKLFYQSGDSLKSLDLLTFNDNSIALPEKGIMGFQINKDLLYIAGKTGISIYKIQEKK